MVLDHYCGHAIVCGKRSLQRFSLRIDAILPALCFYLARVANKHVTRATIAAVAILIIVLWQSIGLFPYWYSSLSWVTWVGALIFAIALAAFELRRLIGDASFVVVARFSTDG